MILVSLFFTFLFVGAFSFGGGYAMLPLIQQEVVSHHHWLTLHEFTDLLVVAEMTPGPVAVNTATYVGYKTGGVLGSALATLGVVLPSFLVMTILAGLVLKYQEHPRFQAAFQGLRPVIVALVIGVALILGRTTLTTQADILLALVALAIMRFTSLHPLLLILGFGLLGLLL